jgi:proline iminopeptidase
MWWNRWWQAKAFHEDFLPEENGHRVWFAEFGNPQGRPILLLHGGPGGCCRAGKARYVDLRRYRLIMFDQRGCGKSRPTGKPENNTTADLLHDMDRLLNHLNIHEKVILWGGSWGSTLALLWAEKYPERVDKLLLSQIFLADKTARAWEFDGAGHLFPEFVEKLQAESKGDIVRYYNGLIQSDDVDLQLKATNQYGWFERVCGSLEPHFGTFEALDDAELASQRIYMNYAAHHFYMPSDDEILQHADKIAEIDALIVHNRGDCICPVVGAYRLAQKLKNVRLVIVPEFGHVGKKLSQTIQKEIKKTLSK